MPGSEVAKLVSAPVGPCGVFAVGFCALLLACPGPASAAHRPAPKIRVGNVSATEGGVAAFPVTLSRLAKKNVSMHFATADGTATASGDYLAGAARVKFAPGQRRRFVRVALAGNLLDEDDRSFKLRLSRPRRARIVRAQATATIRDDDPAPTVSAGDAQVIEGTSGTVALEFTVSLSGPSTRTVSIAYSTAPGTATAPADFAAASGTVEFAPGETSDQVAITVVSDYGDDPDETFSLQLSSPVNASIPSPSAQGTIDDDDPACVVSDGPAGAIDIGDVSGDLGHGSIERNDLISPCGDSDWFSSRMTEDSSALPGVALTTRVTLEMSPNDSPQAGDLDLCVRADAP
jgi:hypothetical protein